MKYCKRNLNLLNNKRQKMRKQEESEEEKDSQRNADRFKMGNRCEGFDVNKQPQHSEQNKDFPNHRATHRQKHKHLSDREEGGSATYSHGSDLENVSLSSRFLENRDDSHLIKYNLTLMQTHKHTVLYVETTVSYKDSDSCYHMFYIHMRGNFKSIHSCLWFNR